MRFLTRIPRPAAILAAGLATALLGTVAALGPSAAPTTAAPHPSPRAVATVTGDDNGDGRIEEDESGWDCSTMGNRQCGPDVTGAVVAVPVECEHNDAPMDVFRLCQDVAAQPAYGWTNPDGSQVGIPAGQALISGLDEEPGTAAWSDALRALHAEYVEHAPRA